MLAHVIPLNERHLRRLLREYMSYYNEDRIHDTLCQGCTEHTTDGGPTVTSGVDKLEALDSAASIIDTAGA